ncbi:hypothetical protein SDC9_112485 [bioreactor metagenome]|uniref:Uncharacterized protein n=1 Tax=bioreactor metagenome TaxID=1076179 RepID=A0A645BKG5_9ZZZZ
MNFSVGALRAAASSTSSRIRETEDSLYGLVTRIRIVPESFTKPESTVSPIPTDRGTDSPVSADVSTADSPWVTSPSSGIRSPGRTSIIAPTSTTSGLTSLIPSSEITRAESGRRSIKEDIDLRDRPTARSCMYSPME